MLVAKEEDKRMDRLWEDSESSVVDAKDFVNSKMADAHFMEDGVEEGLQMCENCFIRWSQAYNKQAQIRFHTNQAMFRV